jgi:hypothetical protein
VNTSVTLTVTVKDTAGDPIQNAQVAILVESSGEILMNEDTTAGGIATEAANVSASTPVSVRVRKGSSADDPKYKPVFSPQVTTSDGLDIGVTLEEDPTNNS